MIVDTDRVAWWHVVAGEGGEVLETHLGDIDLSGGRVAGGQWSPG